MADTTAPVAPPVMLPPVLKERRSGTPWPELLPFALMMVITGGVFALGSVLAFHEVPSGNHDVLISLMASITTVWVGGGSFYFGSTAGNRTKDNAIASMAAKVPAVDSNTTTTTTTTPATTTTVTTPAKLPDDAAIAAWKAANPTATEEALQAFMSTPQ